MKIVSLAGRAVFLLLIPFIAVTLVSSEAAYSQTSDPIDPTHNFPSQSQSDNQRPNDDVGDPRQEEESRREQTERENDRVRQEEQERRDKERLEEKERQKERADEEKRRRQENEDRLRVERERKAAEQRDRIQKVRERNHRRIEQQREKHLLKPDLVVDNLEALPPGVIQHQTVTLMAFVRNASEKQTRDIPIHFYLDQIPITEKVLNLKPGEARQVEITVPMATPGSQTFTVKIDPNNKIAEKTKRNNNLTRTVEVTPAPYKDKQSDPETHVAGDKQQKPQPTIPASKKGRQTEPTPKALGSMKKHPAKPEPPDQSIFMDKGDKIADLKVSVPASKNNKVTGSGDDVTVNVTNAGKLAAMKHFTVGICKAKDAHLGGNGKYVAKKFFQVNPATGFKPGSSRMVQIPLNITKQDLQFKYVAIVDIYNEVNEGKDKGEKNNISNVFQYFIPQVSINSLSIDPSCLPTNTSSTLNADVVGENKWSLYYDSPGGTLSTKPVWGSPMEFPDKGIPLPPLFNTSKSGLTGEVKIRLKAENTVTGGSDMKTITVKQAYPFDGKLTITSSAKSYNQITKKVDWVALNIKAESNDKNGGFFKINQCGQDEVGSIYLHAIIVSKGWGYLSQEYSGLRKEVTTVVSADMYSAKSTPGMKQLKQVKPMGSGPIHLHNGKAEFSVSFKPQHIGEVKGYFYAVKRNGKLQKTSVYPHIGITLYYYSGGKKKWLEHVIWIKNAYLPYESTYGKDPYPSGSSTPP